MDAKEIQEEINKLEQEETTYTNCSKLAVLYCVNDHIKKQKVTAGYSYGSSEFLLAVSKAPTEEVYKILDEHMQVIQAVHPKEYSAVIKKIKERASI